MTVAERAHAVAAAAAHDLNDELTIIWSGVEKLLIDGRANDPNRGMLLSMETAAKRCNWKLSALLNYSVERGAKPNAASMERFIESDKAA